MKNLPRILLLLTLVALQCHDGLAQWHRSTALRYNDDDDDDTSSTHFPRPGTPACRGGDNATTSRVCDPDGVLGSVAVMQQIQHAIVQYEHYNVTCNGKDVGVQMGVYVVESVSRRNRAAAGKDTTTFCAGLLWSGAFLFLV